MHKARLQKHLVVCHRLVCIIRRKAPDGLHKRIGVPNVPGQRQSIPRPGVSPSQQLAANLRVLQQSLAFQVRHLDRRLVVIQLPHQVLPILDRRPTQQNIRQQLHRPLALRHPPPLVDGRRLRLRYVTQVNIRPPTFALFASKPGELPDGYRRYLVNLLRQDFDLPGVPIRMMLRKGKHPYAT